MRKVRSLHGRIMNYPPSSEIPIYVVCTTCYLSVFVHLGTCISNPGGCQSYNIARTSEEINETLKTDHVGRTQKFSLERS